MRCLERNGHTKTGLSDVARELGITRQTVYRYFGNTENLLVATAIVAVEPFFEQLVDHCSNISKPDDLVVESIAYSIEHLPKGARLSLFLANGRSDFDGVTSPTVMQFGHMILRRFPIHWSQIGYDSEDLDELVEFILRILQSFVLDSGDPPRDGVALRRYLQRWVAPAVAANIEAKI